MKTKMSVFFLFLLLGFAESASNLRKGKGYQMILSEAYASVPKTAPHSNLGYAQSHHEQGWSKPADRQTEESFRQMQNTTAKPTVESAKPKFVAVANSTAKPTAAKPQFADAAVANSTANATVATTKPKFVAVRNSTAKPTVAKPQFVGGAVANSTAKPTVAKPQFADAAVANSTAKPTVPKFAHLPVKAVTVPKVKFAEWPVKPVFEPFKAPFPMPETTPSKKVVAASL